MIQVLDRAKPDHRKIRYAPLKVSIEPLVCPGVGNLNNMPADMALSGRDGRNLLATSLSATSVSTGGENFLVVFIFSGVYLKISKELGGILKFFF